MPEAALPRRQKVGVWNVITAAHVQRNQAEGHAAAANNALQSEEMHE